MWLITWQFAIGGSPVGGCFTPACTPRLYCHTPDSPEQVTTRAREGSRLNWRAGGIAHCRSSRFSNARYCRRPFASRGTPVGTSPPASSARICSWIWNARSNVSRNSLLPSIEPPLLAEKGGKSCPTGTMATALAIRCTGATSVSFAQCAYSCT